MRSTSVDSAFMILDSPPNLQSPAFLHHLLPDLHIRLERAWLQRGIDYHVQDSM